MIHIHSDEEKGALHNAVRASPGMALDIRIKKKVKSSVPFPYTNCTLDSQAIDPAVCEKRCLSAVIASECCGQDLDALAGNVSWYAENNEEKTQGMSWLGFRHRQGGRPAGLARLHRRIFARASALHSNST